MSAAIDIRESHYTVTRHPHGLVVRGLLRLRDLEALGQFAAALGFDLLDGRLSAALGACCVLVSTESSLAWRRSLSLPIDGGIARVGVSPFGALLAASGEARGVRCESLEDDLEQARRH